MHFPAEIPERLGLALVSRLRQEGRQRLRAALHSARPASATAELALLEKLAKPPRIGGGDVSRAKHPMRENLAPGVELRQRHTARGTEFILSGHGVDGALLARLRVALVED